MEQEAAEKLKSEEPWRITDNELELYKAKVLTITYDHVLHGSTRFVYSEYRFSLYSMRWKSKI